MNCDLQSPSTAVRHYAIDKLDIRVPSVARFRPAFGELERELRMTGSVTVGDFRPSEHYRAFGDLRQYGVPVKAHLSLKHGAEANHKLELLDTGAKGYREMLAAVEKVFDVDPRDLEVMRVDLAADVTGVPVSWFKQHCRAQFKRFGAEYEDAKAVSMGRCGVETFNYGKRPNFFRIYNKIEEWKHGYGDLARQLRRVQKLAAQALQNGVSARCISQHLDEQSGIAAALAAGVPPELACKCLGQLPSFEELYGYPTEGVTLTRVERQVAGGGSRIPDVIGTVGKLKNAPEFNPFDRLEFLRSGQVEPPVHKYEINTYMAGQYVRSRVLSEGLHHVRAWLNRVTHGHGARTLETYRDFIPASEAGVTVEELYELYRDSVSQQLAA